MHEGKCSPEAHALKPHERGEEHGRAAADASGTVKANGLVAREERGAEVADALEVRCRLCNVSSELQELRSGKVAGGRGEGDLHRGLLGPPAPSRCICKTNYNLLSAGLRCGGTAPEVVEQLRPLVFLFVHADDVADAQELREWR